MQTNIFFVLRTVGLLSRRVGMKRGAGFCVVLMCCLLLSACGGKTVDLKRFAAAWVPAGVAEYELTPEQGATEISRCLGGKNNGLRLDDPQVGAGKNFITRQDPDGNSVNAIIYYYYGETFLFLTERSAIALNYNVDDKGHITSCFVEKTDDIFHK